METQILQVHQTNAIDFENKIFSRLEQLINGLGNKLQNPDQDTLLTRQQTADMLSVSLVTLWAWTKKNIIPAHRIGNKVRYKKSEVLASLHQMNKFIN